MAEKKSAKEAVKKEKDIKYKITKSNGKVIFREAEFANEAKLKRCKARGWKVEEV